MIQTEKKNRTAENGTNTAITGVIIVSRNSIPEQVEVGVQAKRGSRHSHSSLNMARHPPETPDTDAPRVLLEYKK